MKKVNIDLLKKLRQTTLVSFALCKEALLVSDNDFDEAVQWLKVKGVSQGAKWSFHQVKEGVCQVFTKKNTAILLELNCETDFVAKNKQFFDFFLQIGQIILSNDSFVVDAVLKLPFQDGNVKDKILQLSSLLGEKISLGKLFFVKKKEQQAFACYNHSNNKVCSLLVLSTDFNSKEDLVMQVVALKPQFISLKNVSKMFLTKERDLIVEQVNKNWSEKTPTNIKEKIIFGKLQKSLKEVCLVEQKFIKNSKQTVADYLASINVQVLKMFILQVGEE